MKKRRVLYIVGAIVAAVTLFAGFALISAYNSTDAEIERAIAQIATDYEFELTAESSSSSSVSLARAYFSKFYETAPMSANEAAEVVAVLRNACTSCTYSRSVSGARLEMHIFDAEKRDRARIGSVTFVPDHKLDYMPMASIIVTYIDDPSLWQRIKGLWPW